MAFAENQFELSEVVDGASLREHYTILWKRTGVKPEQLSITCPYALEYLWAWFIALHETRQEGMSGAQAITYQEIIAWSQLTGNEPTSNDIAVIRMIDRIATKPKKDKL